ncbi:MAG: hypothetical protein GY874_15040 [Desulfobacteraceae bacterium]|nr:hypothetical protein [Desulfobacteraceae bacterium]
MHSHAPEEIYLLLSGEIWREAKEDPEAPACRKAGQVIHHPSHRRYALTTGDKPTLLLALWRGGGFQKPETV